MMTEPYASYRPPMKAVLPEARVQAFRHPLVAPPPIGFNGGIVIDDASPHQRLRHSRCWSPVDHFDPSLDFSRRLDGRFLYFGPIYDHFGHVMAEMIHRLIPSLKQFGRRQLLMVDLVHDGPARTHADLPSFLKDVLRIAGVGEGQVTIVHEDVTVSELMVCEQGSDLGFGPKDGYLSYLSEIVSPQLDALLPRRHTGSKVYVSRSGLPPGGSFLGESYVEEHLADEGFMIFHPQNFDLLVQMQVYRSADVLVFPEGSACHGTELLGEHELGACHILERRRDHRHVFDRILRPRAREIYRLEGSPDIGTALIYPPDGSLLEHLGLWLFRPVDLIAHFRDHGLATLAGFDRSRYLDRARQDLARYAQHWASSSFPVLSREQFEIVVRNFDRTIRTEVG